MTITCPYCAATITVEDNEERAEVEHMKAEHPDIVTERLKSAGFRQVNGEWVDLMAQED